MIDNPNLESLQTELPSLRCLRLNSDMNEDGVIDHNDSDSDDSDIVDDGDEEADLIDSHQLMFPYHTLESEASSDEDIEDFEDAHHDHDDLESLEDMDDSSNSGNEEDL